MTLTGMASNCAGLSQQIVSGCDSGALAGAAGTYAEVLQQVLGLNVDIELAALGVLGEVEGGDLGDVLVLALALLLLELEGDTADGATLDALHQVRGVTGNLRPHPSVSNFLLPSSPSPGVPRSRGSAVALLRWGGGRIVLTLLRRRLEAMMAISSQMRLLVSKSRVSLG